MPHLNNMVVSRQIDIYALGKVIQYMLTGTDKRNVTVQNKDLNKIIEKCTAFSPDGRYQSASAVKRSLFQYQNRLKKKIQYGVLGLIAFITLFTAGFVVGRYTNVLHFEKKDSFALLDVEFTEPIIKDAVRTMLGKDEDQPLLEEELKYVTELYIVGSKVCTSRDEYDTMRYEHGIYNFPRATIETLEELRKLENLRNVHIVYQTLFDASGLADNKKLESVSLFCCNILDASSFKELSKLERLELLDSKLTDFSALDTLPNFGKLYISADMEQYLSTLSRDDVEITAE